MRPDERHPFGGSTRTERQAMSEKTTDGIFNLNEAMGLSLANIGNKDHCDSQSNHRDRVSYSWLSQRRTGQPVRRHSWQKGREGTFWRDINRKEARQIVFAARRYELNTKQAGKRTGALGGVALEILDYFANLVDYSTGRLDPSINHLRAKLRRSKDAIVRALDALRRHGFLEWKRRYVPANDETGRIQVQQTSNAYRIRMPKIAKKLMGKYGVPSPIPDDEAHRIAELDKQLKEFKASLSLSELPLFELGKDDKLAQSLARLGALIEAKNRESVEQAESLSKDSPNRDNPSDTT